MDINMNENELVELQEIQKLEEEIAQANKKIAGLKEQQKLQSARQMTESRRHRTTTICTMGAVCLDRFFIPYPSAKNKAEADANAKYISELFDQYIPENRQRYTTKGKTQKQL